VGVGKSVLFFGSGDLPSGPVGRLGCTVALVSSCFAFDIDDSLFLVKWTIKQHRDVTAAFQ
jgi:hypothetical protein